MVAAAVVVGMAVAAAVGMAVVAVGMAAVAAAVGMVAAAVVAGTGMEGDTATPCHQHCLPHCHCRRHRLPRVAQAAQP